MLGLVLISTSRIWENQLLKILTNTEYLAFKSLAMLIGFNLYVMTNEVENTSIYFLIVDINHPLSNI